MENIHLVETNRHHLWWNRKDFDHYKLSSEVRNHPQSIQEMVIPIHNELHHYVQPISPPSAKVSRMILQGIHDANPRYSALDTAKSLVQDLYDTEASEYADHLDRQIPFMELSLKAMKQRHIK